MRWIQEFEAFNYVSMSERGQHSKVASPIMTDMEFRAKFIAHIREASRPEGILLFRNLSMQTDLSDILPSSDPVIV
jgi:hypothetical protein